MTCSQSRSVQVEGIPDYLPKPIVDECHMQIVQAVEELISLTGLEGVSLQVRAGDGPSSKKSAQPPPLRDVAGLGDSRRSGNSGQRQSGDEPTVEERAAQYEARHPLYGFDFLVVPETVLESLLSSVDLIKLEEKVFDHWNLRSIEPFPRSALNFHGPSGTGKTLAAHAVASYLGMPILLASYAEIESKFVGDASKNIEAVFFAAEREGAILFIDEADSLLSRRLTNVTQGAEQAINSMRSQLLLCLERYKGIAIFSTNLVENYDQAFQTRMRYIYFPPPDQKSRRKIWERHLPSQLPLGNDVSLDELAGIEGICGRDIKNAVIDTALRAARKGVNVIHQAQLLKAVERVKSARVGKQE